ncbi:hypothetical protein EON63_07400 [archaeon]|nr:MAG: hypothetical protein EON63_07400 [archaeon]
MQTGGRLDRRDYYIKMTKARFVLGLPGLGYDCFRHWEVMTMGSIIILEKGVGLERTVSSEQDAFCFLPSIMLLSLALSVFHLLMLLIYLYHTSLYFTISTLSA